MENKKDSKNKYEATIGLETHIELSTATKMFCGCRLSFGAEPNTFTCPVCLGHPGSLPVINKKAIEFAIKIAIALNCKINEYTIFHRKNYFYPDMPKNYQISQYDLPIGSKGYLDVDMGDYVRRVGITRVHMEEDTGKLVHLGSTGRISESDSSIVDFNRAGTPLVEIVTEPDIKTPAEAKEYLINLRNLILYLDVSDCSMEQGSLRCDANISIKAAGDTRMGTKTEIKNLNSFRFLERALEYEIERQTELLKSGEKIIQQTRHYDNITDSTKPLRTKEEAHDYRYFPEPDLVPILVDEKVVSEIKEMIPELPFEKVKRYRDEYGLSEYDSKLLVSSREMAEYFERCISVYKDGTKAGGKNKDKDGTGLNTKDEAKTISNWLMGDFSALLNKENQNIDKSRVTPEMLYKLLIMIKTGKISSKIAKSVFQEMFYKGTDPQKIIESRGLEQISDEKLLEEIIDRVIDQNPDPVQQFMDGKKKAIGFLIGQVMKQTGGKANPKLVNQMISKKIKQ
jgi:aspartyl-tRNA(Asn)/glutamyl-tRNA(Gln) amidotransferase subunit B